MERQGDRQEAPRRVVCHLVDIEGTAHAVPEAWRGTCRAEVEHRMVHVRAWVPFIVAKVVEVEVEG